MVGGNQVVGAPRGQRHRGGHPRLHLVERRPRVPADRRRRAREPRHDRAAARRAGSDAETGSVAVALAVSGAQRIGRGLTAIGLSSAPCWTTAIAGQAGVTAATTGSARKRDRLARLLSVVSILYSKGGTESGVPVSEIARLTGMTTRTVYRDINALDEELGVPVYQAGRGPLRDRSQVLPATAAPLGARGDRPLPRLAAHRALVRPVRRGRRQRLHEAGRRAAPADRATCGRDDACGRCARRRTSRSRAASAPSRGAGPRAACRDRCTTPGRVTRSARGCIPTSSSPMPPCAASTSSATTSPPMRCARTRSSASGRPPSRRTDTRFPPTSTPMHGSPTRGASGRPIRRLRSASACASSPRSRIACERRSGTARRSSASCRGVGLELAVTVAGIVEIQPWIMSWGGAVEVLEPEALRKAVASSVRQAAERYAG